MHTVLNPALARQQHIVLSVPGEGSVSYKSGTRFEEQRDHMDPGNVDQGDSCHGHRKILCQPARTLRHTWTVDAGGP